MLMLFTLTTVPFCRADEVQDLVAVVGEVYDRIPDADYCVTFWLNQPCSSCEEARRVAYKALYEGVARQVQVTSTYPTVQTGC